MPIGKDSIQKRVAKNATTEPTPVAEPVVEAVEESKPTEPVKKPAAPKKPATTQKKPATTKKSTTSTTTKKTTTPRKPATKKPAPAETPAEPATTVIANISPEVVEKVVGHEEGAATEHVQIGSKMPTYLL